MELILLAAGKGSRIYRKIKKNKCLININRKTLIQKIIDDFKKHYHNDKIKIILGYKKKNITNSIKKDKSINFINNKNFASREMLYSLYLGLKKSNSDVIISYTDFIGNKATSKGAVFQWDLKPPNLEKVTYDDNKCNEIINKETYEPDFLALLIPKN